MSDRKKRQRRVQSARKRADEHMTGFESSSVKLPDGVSFWSVKKAGVYRIEIIPYMIPEGANNPYMDDGNLHFERTYWAHRSIGPDNDTVICPRKTTGTPCPICDHRTKLTKDSDGDEDLIKDLAPKERQLWNVFDHDETEKGVQVWDVSYHLFGKQLDARIKNADEEDGYEFFHDPDEGMTLKIGFEEKNFAGVKFYSAESIDFKPRRSGLDEDLLEKAVVLDKTLVVKSTEQLKKLFFQIESDKGKDEDEKEKPRKGTKPKDEDEDKPKKSKKFPTAEEYGIEKGDEVIYEGQECIVTKISNDGTSLTLMNEDDEVIRAVGAEEVELINEEAPAKKEKPKKEEPRKEKPKKTQPKDEDEDDEWDDEWEDD